MAITDKDVKKLSEVLATKDDLERFATKDDLADLKNDVVTRLDKVMGELEKAREDRVFARGKDKEQDRRLEDLEGRAQKIEAKVVGGQVRG